MISGPQVAIHHNVNGTPELYDFEVLKMMLIRFPAPTSGALTWIYFCGQIMIIRTRKSIEIT